MLLDTNWWFRCACSRIEEFLTESKFSLLPLSRISSTLCQQPRPRALRWWHNKGPNIGGWCLCASSSLATERGWHKAVTSSRQFLKALRSKKGVPLPSFACGQSDSWWTEKSSSSIPFWRDPETQIILPRLTHLTFKKIKHHWHLMRWTDRQVHWAWLWLQTATHSRLWERCRFQPRQKVISLTMLVPPRKTAKTSSQTVDVPGMLLPPADTVKDSQKHHLQRTQQTTQKVPILSYGYR